MPCNYFQRIENDLDETARAFRPSRLDRSYGLDEMPEIAVTETEYGIRREGSRSGGGVNISRTAHFMMPNINLVDLPPSPALSLLDGEVAWRVPVDERTMMTYAHRSRLTASPSGAAKRPAQDLPGREADRRRSVTEDMLAGRHAHPGYRSRLSGLFLVEDNVALAGQGRITDRSKDWLGQSDRGVILLRRIFERELAALADGKPLKDWKRPASRLDLAVSEVRELSDLRT